MSSFSFISARIYLKKIICSDTEKGMFAYTTPAISTEMVNYASCVSVDFGRRPYPELCWKNAREEPEALRYRGLRVVTKKRGQTFDS
jgi:hypothetical protein